MSCHLDKRSASLRQTALDAHCLLGLHGRVARALRIQRAGGNERKEIFRDGADHFHFLELLSQSGDHFGLRVHAYVLMDNQYHLLLETPEANLSRAMHWLNAGYCEWFNRRHSRSGHLLQGRFGAFIVEDDAGWQEVARYVHLNPVRIARLGLDKATRARASAIRLSSAPDQELVAERLRVLREFRWSSYPGYAGYCRALDWVWHEPLARLCGGNNPEQQCAAIRDYTESAVLQDGVEPPWSRVIDAVVLGSEAFAQRLRREARSNARKQISLRRLAPPPTWSELLSVLEQAGGESWCAFVERHGDWGRDAALYLGRRLGRLSLTELGTLVGGFDYAVVSKAIARFGHRLATDDALRQQITAIQARLSK